MIMFLICVQQLIILTLMILNMKKKIKKKIKTQLITNVSVTKSNNYNKYSYHVFFNNLIFKNEEIYFIKKVIKHKIILIF